MAIKGLIFDMDGLMLDTEGMYAKTSAQAAQKTGLPYSDEFEQRFTGAGDAMRQKTYHDAYDAAYGQETVDQFLALSRELVEAEFAAGNIEKKPGLVELLEAAQAKGVQSIVASSNKRDVVTHLLAHHDLTDKFVDVVTSADVDEAKPDPAIFNLAQAKLGFAKDEVIVLEDSRNGIKAADNAQIPVIMIPDRIAPDADMKAMVLDILPSLNEVRRYL